MNPHQEHDVVENCPVGRDPRKIESVELERLGHPKKPLLQAIREKCMDCCMGSPAEVRRCGIVNCSLWPYRMNSNPHREVREMTENERALAAARLAAGRAKARAA